MSAKSMSRWYNVQRQFETWYQDETIRTPEYVEKTHKRIHDWFIRHGVMTGRTVDIGGGYGDYGVYCLGNYSVCDPSSIPTKPCYKRIQRKGEEIGGPSKFYDTVLISSTLDHTEHPSQVIAQAFRILKPGGRLLILQSITDMDTVKVPSIWSRVIKYARNPRAIWTRLVQKWKYRGEEHMHEFKITDILEMLKPYGQQPVISHTGIPGFYAFDTRKELR